MPSPKLSSNERNSLGIKIASIAAVSILAIGGVIGIMAVTSDSKKSEKSSVAQTSTPTATSQTPVKKELPDEVYEYFKRSFTWNNSVNKNEILSCEDGSFTNKEKMVYSYETNNTIDLQDIDQYFSSNGWVACGKNNGAASTYGTYKKDNYIGFYLVSASAAGGSQTLLKIAK